MTQLEKEQLNKLTAQELIEYIQGRNDVKIAGFLFHIDDMREELDDCDYTEEQLQDFMEHYDCGYVAGETTYYDLWNNYMEDRND